MSLSERKGSGCFLLYPANGYRSLENLTLNAAQNLQAGTVLGAILAAGAATAVGSPTGNGVITVGALGPAVQPGVYKLVGLSEVSNAGTLGFYAPDGSLIRVITVAGGAQANDHITLTVADGSNDFDIGDTFTITVTAGDVTKLALAGVDGSEIAVGILLDNVNAVADTKAAVVVRDCEVNGKELTWPDSITDGQKASYVAALAAKGIIVR